MAVIKNYEGQLARKLQDYRSRAHSEGRKMRPSSDAAAPDHNESELKSEGEGWLSAEQALFDATLTDISKSNTETKQKVRELEQACDQILQDDTAEGAVKSELAGMRANLVKVTEARLRAEAEYNYFRETNQIVEEANYPESKIWHFAMLAVFALAEVVANAFFFENSEGLLGGFVVALGIAAVNMGSAMLLGFWFRHQNLASVLQKISGWAAVALAVVIVFFCNALFAAFRSEYQAVLDPSDAAQLGVAFRNAWPQAMLIFKADMAFRDHWSFLLFGIGIILSILAFWKGYTLEDKYPGYGHKDRVFKAAVQAEQREVANARQRVKDIFQRKSSAVQAALQEPGTLAGMFARRVADLEHARDSMNTRVAAIRRDYGTVNEAYRHANTAVRSTEAPAYFREPVELSTTVSTQAAEPLIADMQQQDANLKQFAQDRREGLNAKVNELRAKETEMLTAEMSAYLAEIRDDAQTSINARNPSVHRVQAA